MIGSTGAKSAAEEGAGVRILPSGTSALLLELDGVDEVRAWHVALMRAGLPDVVDLVPAARTLLVVVDPARAPVPAHQDVAPVPTLDDLARRLRELQPARDRRPDDAAPGQSADSLDELQVPVRYDGEDLAEVAALWGCDAAEVVRRHTGERWTVAFCGFAPGFGYLVADDGGHRWEVPRRDVPRTSVPAGSVGLAGPYTGVYPRASPGGWQLVGRTTLALFDVTREPPALLIPGRRVRFVDVT
jgi:KipI family sensor histidine kinase inhibitor